MGHIYGGESQWFLQFKIYHYSSVAFSPEGNTVLKICSYFHRTTWNLKCSYESGPLEASSFSNCMKLNPSIMGFPSLPLHAVHKLWWLSFLRLLRIQRSGSWQPQMGTGNHCNQKYFITLEFLGESGWCLGLEGVHFIFIELHFIFLAFCCQLCNWFGHEYNVCTCPDGSVLIITALNVYF